MKAELNFRSSNLWIKLGAVEQISVSHESTGMPDTFCKLLYVYSGKASVQAGGELYKLNAGSFLVLIGRHAYRLAIHESKSVVFVMDFQKTSSGGVDLFQICQETGCTESALQHAGAFSRIDVDGENLRLTIQELQIELKKGGRHSPLIVDALVSVLFCKILRNAMEHGRSIGISYITQARNYIQQNIEQDFSTQELADELGIHRSYLTTLFKKHLGCTPRFYINRLRVTRAANYLSTTKHSITDIAFLSGFNSRQHFSHIFLDLMGCTPSQYRLHNHAAGHSPILNFVDTEIAETETRTFL